MYCNISIMIDHEWHQFKQSNLFIKDISNKEKNESKEYGWYHSAEDQVIVWLINT